MMIFLVMGSTGEYSDRGEWNVRAYDSEEDAKACVERLAAWCDARGCGENGNGKPYRGDDKPDDDPQFAADYTGTRYSYESVELVTRAT